MATPDAVAGGRSMLAPLAILLGLGTIWGLSFSLAKIATSSGAHPFGLLLWQAVLATTIVVGFCAARRRLAALTWRHWRYYLGCGVCGIVLPSGAIFYAAPHLPAGVMSILLGGSAMMTYAMALPVGLERFHGPRVAGLGLGFVAVLLIVGPDASLPASGLVGWVVVGLVAPLCYAANTVFIAYFRPANTDSLALAIGMLASATLLIAPTVLATGTAVAVGAPWDAVDLAVLGTGMITGVAQIFMFELIRRTGPVYFSQVAYLVTAAGVFWGMMLFGERHSPWIWAALALMIAGLALVNRRQRDTAVHNRGD